MSSEIKTDEEAPASSKPRSPIRRILALVAYTSAGLALVLFCVNLFGFNQFLYLNVSGDDWIVGASCGVLHAAITPHADMTVHEGAAYDPYDVSELQSDLIVAGPVHLFVERRLDPLQPFRFDAFENDDYAGFELPMLLFALVLGTCGRLCSRKFAKPT